MAAAATITTKTEIPAQSPVSSLHSSPDGRITDFISIEISPKNKDNYLREEYQVYIEDLKTWVVAQENLDIYQVIALVSGSQINGKYTFRAPVLSLAKLYAVVFIQTSGIIYLIQDQVGDKTDSSSWCRSGEDAAEAQVKQFAACFALFISLLFYNAICELTSKGMYLWGMEAPCFVSKSALANGAMINLYVALTSWILSILILYFNDGVLDMVLNSVALYFLLELDDEAVFFSDYQNIANWMELHYDDFIDDYYTVYAVPGKERKQKWCGCCCCMCKDDNACTRGMLACTNFMGNKKYNRLIFVPFIVVLPLYILFCV